MVAFYGGILGDLASQVQSAVRRVPNGRYQSGGLARGVTSSIHRGDVRRTIQLVSPRTSPFWQAEEGPRVTSSYIHLWRTATDPRNVALALHIERRPQVESDNSLAKSPDPGDSQPNGIRIRGKHEPAARPENSFAGLWVILLIRVSIVTESLAAGLPRPLRQILEVLAVLSLSGVALTAPREDPARRLDPLKSEPDSAGK